MSDLLEINTASNIAANLGVLADSVPTQVAPQFSGRLTRMVGLTLEAVGCQSVVGDRCLIHSVSGDLIEA